MKFKKERMIKHTNIPGPTEVSTKVIGYPHHQFSILANYPVVVSQFPISIIWNFVQCPYSNCPIDGPSGKVSAVREEANRSDGVRVTANWRKERITSNCIPYTCSIVVGS